MTAPAPSLAALLAAAEALGWPPVRAGRLRIRAGELAWRQAVTLASEPELRTLRATLERPALAEGR